MKSTEPKDLILDDYLKFTLTTGIGFWPAAIVTSLLMGGMHYFNPAGHGLGPVATTMYCLVTCLVLRRTGDLWMPLGIHAAWGWGEVYFYGVPDSGYPADGHLFGASFHGNPLLTGRGFGPEASIFLPGLADYLGRDFLRLAAWSEVSRPRRRSAAAREFANGGHHRTKGLGVNEIHTLASSYADTGKTKETRELLLQAMDVRGMEQPNDAI